MDFVFMAFAFQFGIVISNASKNIKGKIQIEVKIDAMKMAQNIHGAEFTASRRIFQDKTVATAARSSIRENGLLKTRSAATVCLPAVLKSGAKAVAMMMC